MPGSAGDGGGKLGRRTEGWIAAGTGANAELAQAIARLRDRSRDLVRNNPYAVKAVTALVSIWSAPAYSRRPEPRRRSSRVRLIGSRQRSRLLPTRTVSLTWPACGR